MKHTAIIVGILISILGPSTVAAQKMSLNNRQYEKTDGQWYRVENGSRFRVNNSVITLRFKKEVSQQAIDGFNKSQNVRVLRKNILGFIDVKILSKADPLMKVQAYLKSPLIEIAEANTFGEYIGIPNDSLFTNQWHHKHPQDYDIDTPNAWDIETGSPNVTIGILDSGTDVLHEDLEKNIWVNPGEDINNDGVVWDMADINGIDDDGNGVVDDLVGWDWHNDNNDVNGPFYHGTHVAGIAGAVTNNGIGVAGVAGGWGSSSGSKMLIAGVGDSYPDGSILDDAILYAAYMGVDIITMSLSVGQSSAINLAIASAHNTYGVFIDCSSGNSYSSTVSYPASVQNVFAVGASGKSDLKASFSNYGTTLDVVAPGVDIWSTRKNDTYGTGSGTSYAAPQVAGIAALLKSFDATLTNSDIEEIIASTAEKVRTDIYSYNQNKTYGIWNNKMGYGRVNAHDALIFISLPAQPTSLVITNPNGIGNSPILSWQTSTGATSYNVYRRVSWDPNWFLLGSSSSTTYIDGTLEIRNPNDWEAEDFYYQVTAVNNNGESNPSNSVSVWGYSFFKMQNEITDVNNLIPDKFALEQNHPNPFNPTTTIKYELPEASSVTLVIYDLRGIEVTRWTNGNESAGYKRKTWDATDKNGNKVPAGMYLLKMTAESKESRQTFTETNKMVLLK